MAELIGGALGSIQGTIQGFLNKGSGIMDRFMPPERRAELWTRFQKFIHEKPALASFLLSQLALSGPAIALFITLTITVALFALIAGILVGLVGALLFIVAAIGFALIFVLPTLFFTTLLAVFFWLWGMGTYYIIKHFNKKEIPGIHTPLNAQTLGLTGGDSGAEKEKAENGGQKKNQPPKLESRRGENGTNGAKSKKGGENGVVNSLPTKNVTDTVGKTTGVDVGGAVDGVTKKAGNAGELSGGLTENVPVAGGGLKGVQDQVGGLTKNLPVGGGLLG